MRLEHYPAEKLKQDVLRIVGKYLDLKSYRIFIFGSRVNQSDREQSDIDIGIEGSTEVSYEAMGHIKEDVENLPTLYKIEIVDFKKVSDDFRSVALQHIEPIT